MLEIKNLKASINDTEILKGLNLKIGNGEVHAIMGTNGSGKSTLSKVLSLYVCWELGVHWKHSLGTHRTAVKEPLGSISSHFYVLTT